MMSESVGSGELIKASELKIGDVFKTSSRTKKQIKVNYLSFDNKIAVDKTYFFDLNSLIILVQREGIPVPLTENRLR